MTLEYFGKSTRNKWGVSYCCRDCIKKLPKGRIFDKNGVKYEQKKRLKTRMEIVANVNYSCEKCGIKNDHHRFFDIDHIKQAFRKKNGIAGSWRKLWEDKSNLQVLCPNCHRLKHLEDFTGK